MKEKLYIFDTTLRDGAQTYGVDFNDTGFQVVDSDGDLNAAGREYIFMVFA